MEEDKIHSGISLSVASDKGGLRFQRALKSLDCGYPLGHDDKMGSRGNSDTLACMDIVAGQLWG